MMKRLTLAFTAAAAAFSSPALAADLSFVGNFADGNDVQLFNFVVGAPSTVTLRSWSYAGGVNAQGATIDRGGFDPILALFDGNGFQIGQNDDDQTGTVAADAVTGEQFDVFLQRVLGPGNYTVSIQAYSNFAIGPNLSDGFEGDGSLTDVTGDVRNNNWAFDILGVESATQVGSVPEASTWAMMIMGIGFVGFTMRRKAAQVMSPNVA
ncbi:hypothetical protein HNO88_003978 [Novosphingobium chloroacetimidivorans]|uniref:Ice-binding protein C-terminal domain-containing protein n=2 Tax=Novosphingobium chloroacetimidivorans TaxID=1428314 RepID=A0A7W7KE93_9SPHN|nr:hypothetical protein [Novosphingobium chloroacetimidivorans]